jgi:phytoene dehydrogenase-like protein
MRIAIIGAGFSGMLAAYLLEKENFQVTLYEKEEKLGGHCQTLVHKDLYIELGTVFCLCDDIKALLVELGIDFSERFSYRNFIDENYQSVEQMSREQVSSLMDELEKLKHILNQFPNAFHPNHYGTVYEELKISLDSFLKIHGLTTISEAIAPHLSSFGFGNIKDLPAFYAFSVFDFKTINAFIRGEKLLFIDKGFSEVIQKLSKHISDIRYGMEITSILPIANKVLIETAFGTEEYDKVLVSTKLPSGIIKDAYFSALMDRIETHAFMTCAYKVKGKNNVTTYFKAHLGQKNKLQFFHAFKQQQKTVLVAYAYGQITKNLVQQMTTDIEKIGIRVKHLIAVKQWQIFPHFKPPYLSQTVYSDLFYHQKNSNILFIGSLITKPAVASLYRSVKHTIASLHVHS